MAVLNTLTSRLSINAGYSTGIGPGGALSPAGQNQGFNSSLPNWVLGSGGGPGLVSVVWQQDIVMLSGAKFSVDLCAGMSGQFTNYYQPFSFNLIKMLLLTSVLNQGSNSGQSQASQFKAFGNSGGYQHNLQSGNAALINANGIFCYADDVGWSIASGVNSLLQLANLDASGNIATCRLIAYGSTTSG